MLDAALAIAIGIAVALFGVHFLAVPTTAGEWRAVVDPPGLIRVALSVLLGGGLAWLARRQDRLLKTPVLALGLAAAPLLPIVSGHLPLLLALQGPLLVVVASAVAVVILIRTIRFHHLAPPAVPTWALVAVAFLAYSAFGTRVPGGAGPQGDEPHYLLMAASLVSDGDLDLANQYAERQYLPFYGGTLEPHVSRATAPGTAYSTHAPGLAVLVAPAYALGGYRGVVLFLSLLTALTAALLRDVVQDIYREGWTALATWAVVAFTPVLPVYAVAVYPETVAVAVVAIVLWLRRGALGPLTALVAGLLAGGLVWLHPKLLPLGAVAVVALFPQVRNKTARAAAILGFVLASCSFLLYMNATFGRPTLTAGFGNPHLALANLPWGAIAQIFDRQRGLLALGPVWALALFGAFSRLRQNPRDSLLLLALAATPIAVGGVYSEWGGGLGPPGRFPLPVLAPMSVLLAEALRRRPTLGAALGGTGFGVLLVATSIPRVLRATVVGESHLLRDLSPLDLNGLFPSFAGSQILVPLLLTLTATAVLALVWRFGARAAVLALAYLMLADALRDRPLVDPASTTRLAMETFDDDNARGPTGPLDVATLRLPLDIPGGPQPLASGTERRSRRIDLPAGSYRLSVETRAGTAPSEARASVFAGAVTLAEAPLAAGRSTAMPLFLPVGAAGLTLLLESSSGSPFFERAVLEPESLAPRSSRGGLGWPSRIRPDAYRMPRGSVSVTLLEGLEVDGESFRVTAPLARFAVDGPLAATVAIRLRRARPLGSDAFEWANRAIDLGKSSDIRQRLPLASGVAIGRRAVVPVTIRAPGAELTLDTNDLAALSFPANGAPASIGSAPTTGAPTTSSP